MPDVFTERTTPADIDPLDLQLDRLGAAPARVRRRDPWQMRLAIGWSTGSFPAVLLILLGAAFGPQGLTLLTPGVLALVDPAVPVALAALGVGVGLGIARRRTGEGRLFAAASLEAVVTGALVAAGLLAIVPSVLDAAAVEVWLVAAVAAVAASTSSALPSTDSGPRSAAVRIKDLDARLPIVAGALLLALVQAGSVVGGLLLAAQVSFVALTIAAAGWLLLTGTSSDTEQRVFGVAALLLVGGAAEYLGLSALLSGVIAGAFWQLVGGATREAIGRDIGYVQHPLVVILLLVAGAQTTFSPEIVVLAASYVILRTAGKLLGAWFARRVAARALAGDFALHLTSPGIFGVAFAMNAFRGIGPELSALLAAVVIGTVGSQLVAAVGHTREDWQ
jgi:hypothetical protein